jgi:hypothetical protein
MDNICVARTIGNGTSPRSGTHAKQSDRLTTGLFLGSGRSLASAGPGGAVLSYVLMGTVISSVISCLGEMTGELTSVVFVFGEY